LKLSSAEQPPCKRTGVGSIPTWGSCQHQPLVAQRAEAPGSDPGGSWFESTRGDQQRARLRSMRRRSIGRTPGCYPVDVGSSPTVAAPRSSNGRIFGSEPEDAWFESRPRSSPTDEAMAAGRAPTPRRRGFDSFRPCLTRPGLLADRGCRPLKPATRVRIPLGALTTRPWCQRQHAGVPCLRCGFEPRRPLQRVACFIEITCGALVLTGTRAACTREFGVRLPGAPPLSRRSSAEQSATPRRWTAEVRILPARPRCDDGRARDRTGLIRRH
jgi:hypothetical protein